MTINITDLNFSYNKGKQTPIYHNFQAEISQAGVYGLFGRNGSGKSTLLKLIAGLLTASSGTIEVLGYNPRQRLPDFLSQVYILPEEFHLPDLTPTELGNSHHHFYPNFNMELFADYLQKLDVPSEQRFSQMSLGQKKKSTIAFALATCTPILLMDEPTNGLDIVSREQFKALMATPEQAERIVLISTHQAHDLERIISHLWFIDEGQLLLSATVDKINQKLAMGIAQNSQEVPNTVLYQESIGEQIAWIAQANSEQNSTSKLNIEMLYKALNMNKIAIVNAINN
ncbi:MAG: ABC transporter ATP-binding protein [Moraxellaceae bacterium]|nr:ABC transporter ATP-binding protein [Moraxellaceae bacterium]